MGCNREIIHHHTVGLCSLVQSDGLDWGVLIALLSQESLAMAICTNVCGLEHIVGSNCDSSGLVRFDGINNALFGSAWCGNHLGICQLNLETTMMRGIRSIFLYS